MGRFEQQIFGSKQRFAACLAAVIGAWIVFSAVCLITGATTALKFAAAGLALFFLLLVSMGIRYQDAQGKTGGAATEDRRLAVSEASVHRLRE